MSDLYRTLVIHAVQSGNDVSINITKLGNGNDPEVYQSEGKGLAAVLWAHLPEETIEAMLRQFDTFKDERIVAAALARLEEQEKQRAKYRYGDDPDPDQAEYENDPALAEYQHIKAQWANRPEANY